MNDILIPLGWDAMRGQPTHHLRFPIPPTSVVLSETTMERLERIWMPFKARTAVAVLKASERYHADHANTGAAAVYHANRPSMKTCPFDDLCRFV